MLLSWTCLGRRILHLAVPSCLPLRSLLNQLLQSRASEGSGGLHHAGEPTHDGGSSAAGHCQQPSSCRKQQHGRCRDHRQDACASRDAIVQKHCANLPPAAARRARLPLADALFPPAFALLTTAVCLTQLLPAWPLLTAVGPAFLAGVHIIVVRGRSEVVLYL